MIKSMHHTGLVVRDLDAAVQFYRDVVGLSIETTRERKGPPISQVVGYDDTHLKAALLWTGEGHELELLEYVNPLPSERPTEERSSLGASHLAFLVDDVERTYEHLIARGAQKLNPPVEVSPGRTACYLQDPEGNWIELIEIVD